MPSTSTFQADRIAEATNDKRAVRQMRVQHRRTARAYFGDVGWIAHDRSDHYQILDLDTGGAQLCLQVPPCQGTLRPGIFQHAAV